MFIMPNQESEWVDQVLRNIISPALSIQWGNNDFEAKKNVNRKFNPPIWQKGLLITKKNQKTH